MALFKMEMKAKVLARLEEKLPNKDCELIRRADFLELHW